MTQVFIDTNAFLGFYAYSTDDLAQLEKLVAEIKSGNIELLMTQQVVDEFNRNREAKIEDTLKRFNENVNGKFPTLVEHYPQYADLQQALQSHRKSKEDILRQLDQDIATRTLPADKVFDEIVRATEVLKVEPADIDAARYRMAVGNPPGKNNSLGDALNWEILLRSADRGSDLCIVTQDRDYLSPLNKTRISNFLADEWNSKVGGSVSLFRTLKELFGSIAPRIELSDETTAPTANVLDAEGASSPLRLAMTKTYTRLTVVYDPTLTTPDKLQALAEAMVGAHAIVRSVVGSNVVSLVFRFPVEESQRARLEDALHSIAGVGAVSVLYDEV